ncbi:DUF3078 domain-containing protein [Aquimarina agarivorans]|uniref:DUF3078 domain-containing protein n=1 Tax=Aquimarina agarivorans TaxID=980584 RepID=UPI000248E642|nr:DUF3078 domain-containing protein [Aquimarina agarivorans]
MKKLLYVFLILSFFGYSQEEENTIKVTDTVTVHPQAVSTSPWQGKGSFSVLGNQTSFNDDWVGGGISNLAVNSRLEYEMNYKKAQWTWDNRINMAYGITKLKEKDRVRKTDDLIEISSVVGKNTGSGYWSYSGYFNFKTQFAKGYNFDKNDSRTLVSRGFSPAYFQLGPGLLWKKNENFQINLAPATTRLILVDKFFTREKEAFGVDQGETSNIEFGASIAGAHKFELFKNVTLENILKLYSNYLEKVSNVDINYTLNMVSTINKHMTANFSFQTIYDDDTTGSFQVRQMIALGVNYAL